MRVRVDGVPDSLLLLLQFSAAHLSRRIGVRDGLLVSAGLILQNLLRLVHELVGQAVLVHVREHLLRRGVRVVRVVPEHEILHVLFAGHRVELFLRLFIFLPGEHGQGLLHGLPVRELRVLYIPVIVVLVVGVEVVVGESVVLRVVAVQRVRLVPGGHELAQLGHIVLARVNLRRRAGPVLEQGLDLPVHVVAVLVLPHELVEESVRIPLRAGLRDGSVLVRVLFPVVLDSLQAKIGPVPGHVFVQAVDANIVVVLAEILARLFHGREAARLELIVDLRVIILGFEGAWHEASGLPRLILGRGVVCPVLLVQLLHLRPGGRAHAVAEHIGDAARVPLGVLAQVLVQVLFGG